MVMLDTLWIEAMLLDTFLSLILTHCLCSVLYYQTLLFPLYSYLGIFRTRLHGKLLRKALQLEKRFCVFKINFKNSRLKIIVNFNS